MKGSLVSIFSMFMMLPFVISAQTQPNVLLIIVDDLSDYTGFLQGHPQVETPNMDQLAENGTIFANAYCNSPGCAPSRTSFLTGKTPIYTQVSNNKHFLEEMTFRDLFTAAKGNETVFTLPEVLREGGYYSIGFEKVSHKGLEAGYDLDYDQTTSDPCARQQSWSQFASVPFTEPKPLTGTEPFDGVGSLRLGQLIPAAEDYMRDAVNADSVQGFLRAYAADPSQFCNKPFFLAWGAVRPHLPFYAPEQYFLPDYPDNLYAVPLDRPYNDPPNLWPPNGVVMPPRPPAPLTGLEGLNPIANAMSHSQVRDEQAFEAFADTISPFPVIEAGMDSLQAKEVIEEYKKAQAVMAYLASTKFIDGQIGDVMAELQAQNLRSNTIVVLISDHGYALGERNHWRKFALWETDIRIPFVIVDPRKSQGNTSIRTASLIDLFPTILELTATAEPTMPGGDRYLDGESLAQLLEQPDKTHHRPVYAAYTMPQAYKKGNCYPQQSVRSEQFHLIRYRTNGTSNELCDSTNSTTVDELYEPGRFRLNDPDEFTNLVDDPYYDRMRDYLAQWMSEGEFFNRPTPEAIIYKESSCGDDTLVLRAGIRLRNGNIRTNLPSTGFNVQWRIRGGDTLTGTLLKIPVTQPAIEVQLEISRAAQPTPFLLTNERYRLSTDTTDISFTPSISGNLVTLTGVDYPDGITFSRWKYGDGFSRETKEPLQRIYPPGTYTVTRTLKFGPEQSCPLNYSQTFTITAAKQTQAQPQKTVTERLLLFPNPTRNTLKVKFVSNTSQEVTIQVYDTAGKMRASQKHKADYGSNEYRIQLPAADKGLLFLRIQGQDTQLSGSFWVE